MSLTLVTAASPFVTLDEAKLNSRVTHDDDDARIEGLIGAAIAYAERWTSRKFMPSTWDYALDVFPSGSISLPLAPVTSVVSFGYEDALGVPQIVAGYSRDGSALSLSGGWPNGSGIVVRFVAGDGDPEAIKIARQAVLMLVSHWYEARETASEKAMTEIPMGAHALLNLHRQMFV